MNIPDKPPFYITYAFIAFSILSTAATLYIGQQIFIPLIYATILAILLNPIVNLLIRLRINRTIAISFSVVVMILVTVSLLYLISRQAALFTDSYPQLKTKFTEKSGQLIRWISTYFNMKPSAIYTWINETENDLLNNMGGAIGKTISAINGILIGVILMPVYLFMILFYKPLLLEFIHKLSNKHNNEMVHDILINSKKIIQSYLIGLIIEAVIVAILNTVGLLLLDVPYAIILGVTGALLNVIPYIGGVIATAIPMIIAFVMNESAATPLLVLLTYLIIQFVDNHFIIPNIVASKVKINALVCIIVVLAGGALWGIPGMFLSIPLTAILKVIFDHIENLKPFGFVLGNIVPVKKTIINFKKITFKK